MSYNKSVGIDVGVGLRSLDHKINVANARIDGLGENSPYTPANENDWGCGCHDISTIKLALDYLAQFRSSTLSILNEFSHGGMSQNRVTWANMTEVNLSGEKLTNGDFSSVTNNAPTDWTVTSGTLDQAKLAQGIVKGDGGQVLIQQTLSQNIAQGTDLVIKVTSDDDILFYPILSNGVVDNANSFNVLASEGYAEHTTQSVVSGFRISTVNGTREYSSVSVFQGAVAGGSVQVYTDGGIEKINGGSGWNAGAISNQYINADQDGYAQFQIADNTKQFKAGLVYADVDYNIVSPYKMHFNGGNVTVDGVAFSSFVESGDWFRIRQYGADNRIEYQKRETIYNQLPNFALPDAPNNNHASNFTFSPEDRPLVIALQTANGATKDNIYRMHVYNTSSGNAKIYELDGTFVNWLNPRGGAWEVVEEAGVDYATFHTDSVFSSAANLFLDTSFFHVGAKINDVAIVSA